MVSTTKISEDQWIEQYQPLIAPKDDRGFDFGHGCTLITMTDDEEFEVMDNADDNNIWTVLETEEKTVIVSGVHLVNRLGHIITSKPHNGEDIEVILEN